MILLDAMGVLRDFYGVADIVFIGRTLVDLGVLEQPAANATWSWSWPWSWSPGPEDEDQVRSNP